MGELGGWLLFAVGAAIALYTAWTFIPEPVGESVRNLLVRLARGMGWVFARLGRLVQRGMYRLLTGAALPRPVVYRVNSFDDDDLDYVPPPLPVSRTEPRTDPGPSAPSVPSSVELPAQVEALMVDRTRAALIAALVAAGWNTGQIRAQLKGANDVTGKEVEAERQRQGVASGEVRLIALNGGREGYLKM